MKMSIFIDKIYMNIVQFFMICLKNTFKTCTVKQFLRQKGLSQRTITKLSKELGLMQINGKAVIMSDQIKKHEVICLSEQEHDFTPNFPLSKKTINIVYEDDYLLIVDKPSGLPTIPSSNYIDSLASRVTSYFNGSTIFRAINRLDADTTGLVLIVKDVITENLLIANGDIKKWYLAEVDGKTKRKGCINAPIIDNTQLKKRVVHPNGLPAITYYKRLNYKDNKSLIKCHLIYGRTNQIRCHLSYIGHPLTNDKKYNEHTINEEKKFYLRCYKVKFKHPYTNKTIKITLTR